MCFPLILTTQKIDCTIVSRYRFDLKSPVFQLSTGIRAEVDEVKNATWKIVTQSYNTSEP